MISRIIGFCILVLVLGFIFAFTVFASGIKTALIVWGAALFLTALIVVGVYLLFGRI